jgi:steroid 5-alpha reductase family enzyme
MPVDALLADADWHALLPPLGFAWAVLALAFLALWWRQLRTQNATSVDAAWALGIGGTALAMAAWGPGAGIQRLLAAGLAAAWSGRLSLHLLRDRVFGHRSEDGRYAAMRNFWGTHAARNFFVFYQMQAIAAVVFALPFAALAYHSEPNLTPWQWCGLGITTLAVLGETLADRQLAAHRRDPLQRGRTCRNGLWRYSRHPNYFCEWLAWCGMALVAAPALSWLAVLQPVLMFLLVRFVSGVPWTELQAQKSRPDDYRRYQAETNAFVPWWPRRLRDVLHP